MGECEVEMKDGVELGCARQRATVDEVKLASNLFCSVRQNRPDTADQNRTE